MLCGLMKILSYGNVKKKTKGLKGFQILHFHWSFSSDIKAVKGLRSLMDSLLITHRAKLGSNRFHDCHYPEMQLFESKSQETIDE